MGRIIILRGPAGVGKSTIGKALRRRLDDALLFNVDMICSDLVGSHPKFSKSRYEAYELCFLAAKRNPKKNLILERLFLDQKDVDYIAKLFSGKKFKIVTITLSASLKKLIKQDSGRPRPLGSQDVKRLYGLFNNSSLKDSGKIVKIGNKSVKKVVDEIMGSLN